MGQGDATRRRGGGGLGAALLVVGFVAVLWVAEIVDAVLPAELDAYGVRPRSDEGLVGVLLAPLLHSGFDHLQANSLPLLVLGVLIVLVAGVARWLAATAIVWVLAGVGTWLVVPGPVDAVAPFDPSSPPVQAPSTIARHRSATRRPVGFMGRGMLHDPPQEEDQREDARTATPRAP